MMKTFLAPTSKQKVADIERQGAAILNRCLVEPDYRTNRRRLSSDIRPQQGQYFDIFNICTITGDHS